MSDDPQPAARIEDTIQHSQARLGRGLGALGGAALALGVLFLAGALEIGTLGLATPVVIGVGALAVGGIGAAMSAGSNLGADEGRKFMHDDGKIASGIPTVLIGPERRPLAHVNSNVNCNDHRHLVGPSLDVINAAQEQIAEGSGSVLVGPDFMPVARVGSQGTCEFTIGQGCSTVIIGGPTLRLVKVGDGDDPDKGFFDGVGTVSGYIGIAGAALVLWPATLSLAGVGIMGAGGAGAWLVGQAVGKGMEYLPEGEVRDAASLALAVLPLAGLPKMARGLSRTEGLGRARGESEEGFTSRVKQAKNARLEQEWRAAVQASKPRAGEIPLGPDGRPIPAYAGASGAARALFDDGGGVFSPKQGSPLLQTMAGDAARGGAARDPLFDVTKPNVPRTDAEYRALIDEAKRNGNHEEAMRLRRERYLRDCERDNKPVMPADKWREAAERAQENRLRGRVDEDQALSHAGVDNNNYIKNADESDRTITRYIDSKGYETRPDGVSDTHWIDVKSTKADTVYDTEQIRAEREGAIADGKRQGVIISNDDYQATKPSGPLAKSKRTDILHRDSVTGKWRQWDQEANGRRGGWSEEFGDDHAASILGGTVPSSPP